MTRLHILTAHYANGARKVSACGRAGDIPHEAARCNMPVPITVHVWERAPKSTGPVFGWRLAETYEWR